MRHAKAATMTCRLLVVDDEPAINYALSEYFSLRGFCVDSSVDMVEAEEMMSRVAYEIIITDLSLGGRGGTEGLELAAQVRRKYPLMHTVILTAYGSAESEAAARSLGVDAFLHKPISLSEIARVLSHIMTKGRRM